MSEVIRSPSVVALFQARRDLRCNPGDLQGFLRPCIYPTNPSDQPARKKSAPKGVESAETPTRGKMSFMNDESDDEELCAISLRTRSKSKLATPKPGAVGNVGNIFEVRAEAALSQSQRERPASTGRDDPVARSLLTTLDAEEARVRAQAAAHD